MCALYLRASTSASQRFFETAPWRHSCWRRGEKIGEIKGGQRSRTGEAKIKDNQERRTWSDWRCHVTRYRYRLHRQVPREFLASFAPSP